MQLRILLLGSLVVACSAVSPLQQARAFDDERILSYHSEIEIHADSALTVTESITVRAQGFQIKRGIYRDFPTTYRDSKGKLRKVGFDLQQVLRDGSPEPHHTKRLSNGIRIYIGDADVYLPPGEYTYSLTYRTNRQLGFFAAHDELYWNVTGTDWDFPIDSASASVTLPAPVAESQLMLAGYTGPQGAQGQAYEASVAGPTEVFFRTTASLGPHEGLTIVAGFPKGIVTEPGRQQLAQYWIADHRGEVLGVIGLLALLLFYFIAWRLVGVDPRRGTVTPQDAPPEQLSPAAMRYIMRMSPDNVGFTAALISMADKGYLRIEVDEMGINRLVRAEGSEENLSEEERALGSALFTGRSVVEIKQDNHTILNGARFALISALSQQYRRVYFYLNRPPLFFGFLASVALLLGMVLLAGLPFESVVLGLICIGFAAGLGAAALGVLWNLAAGQASLQTHLSPRTAANTLAMGLGALFLGAAAVVPLILLAVIISAWMALVTLGFTVVNVAFALLLPAYTRQGRAVLDRIEGFRLGLAGVGYAVEEGQPPPAVFERRFLPYAIALGVENEWSRRLNQALGESEARESPEWYMDPHRRDFDYHWFSNNLTTTFTATIASASSPPGSSSGGGGGGSSGGGGGGGGGGGW